MHKIDNVDVPLAGKRVAILIADGFEQIEMTSSRNALEAVGAETTVVSQADAPVRGWKTTHWGNKFAVDLSLDQVRAEDFDALLLPGGVMNSDRLRTDSRAISFVRSFFETNKPIAAICHGPWMLIEAEVVRGRRLTSSPSIRTDLKNAGGNWIDEAVVVDHGLVTSRTAADLPLFNQKMIETFGEGVPTEEPTVATHAGAL